MVQKFLSSVVIVSLFSPVMAVASDTAAVAPYEQDFILTAYYSPLPDQCCYIKGSEEADKILNGNGTHGADGTAVYPGMLAAPPTYAFGTRIALPGLGIMTVHDRGGAIQELEKAHRLDVWAGYGEEGLARALAFGVKRIRGTIYPPKTEQPVELMDLATLAAPLDYLKPYIVADAGIMDSQPKAGERALGVTVMQQNLFDLGYLKVKPTGLFGSDTQKALTAFLGEYGLEGDGSILSEEASAYLVAANSMDEKKQDPVSFVGKESSIADVQSAQRLLRYLGYYRGRTDGLYSDNLFSSILKYQQDQKLVGDSASPGAGRIGPMTRTKLVTDWRRRMTAQRAEKLLTMKRIGDLLEKNGTLITEFMSPGTSGSSVTKLQKMLAAAGFFPAEKVNGHYGELTTKAVSDYQIARGLLSTSTEKGAGNIGPITLRRIHDEQIQEVYKTVRAVGWDNI